MRWIIANHPQDSLSLWERAGGEEEPPQRHAFSLDVGLRPPNQQPSTRDE